MMGYDFALTFSLSDPAADPTQYLDALFEAGCDDALIGVGQAGSIALEFDRDAPDAVEAVRSAIADVRTAIPDAEIVEVNPDLIGMSGIADLLGCSRQMVRKYALSKTSGFPKPVHAGTTLALWHLVDVVDWAQQTETYRKKLGSKIGETAMATWTFNLEIQRVRHGARASAILGHTGLRRVVNAARKATRWAGPGAPRMR